MTRNQLEYLGLEETRRNNLVVAQETAQHNRNVEAETNRSNLVNEGIKQGELIETGRHNLVTEANQRYATDKQYQSSIYQTDSKRQTDREIAEANLRANYYKTDKEAETSRNNAALQRQTSLDVAEKNAKSSKDVAKINKSSQTRVAKINKNTQTKVAKINKNTQTKVAKINQATNVQTAKISAAAQEKTANINAQTQKFIAEINRDVQERHDRVQKIINDDKLTMQEKTTQMRVEADYYIADINRMLKREDISAQDKRNLRDTKAKIEAARQSNGYGLLRSALSGVGDVISAAWQGLQLVAPGSKKKPTSKEDRAKLVGLKPVNKKDKSKNNKKRK